MTLAWKVPIVSATIFRRSQSARTHMHVLRTVIRSAHYPCPALSAGHARMVGADPLPVGDTSSPPLFKRACR